MYYKNRNLRGDNEGKVSAICDVYGCKGRAWFWSRNAQFIKLVTSHGCEANPSHVFATAIRNEEKQLATTTTMRTGEIIQQVRNQSRISGIQDSLPQISNRKRGIQRARTNSEDCKPPPIPSSVEDIVIPPGYRLYEAVCEREPDEFFLFDSGMEKEIGGRILGFGRKSYGQWMSCVKKIYGDGTFLITPPLFAQVFVVLSKRKGFVFPIATALLPNKRGATYRRLFQLLTQVFPNLRPQSISCDFELAIQNAARGEWEGVSIAGYYWHLCSNLYKHLQEEGLSNRYNNDPLFANDCRKIVATACAPMQHLNECFDALKKNLPVELTPILLDWFEPNYLGVMKNNGIRQTARFPIDSWHLVERIMKDDDRTDNYAEAHHRKVACALGVAHPNIWRFIDSMKLNQRGTDEVYNEMNLGRKPPIKRKKYRMADERLKELVKEAVKNWAEQMPMEYLSAIAYNFRMGQGPYVLSEETDDEEDSGESDMTQTLDDPNDVCAQEFGIKLTREDLDCLKPEKCLKGEVINYYMQLIIRRSDMDINLPTVYTFDTLFFPRLQEKGVKGVLSSLKNVKLFAKNILLFPIHTPGHWALVVVKLNQRRLIYYDSLLGNGSHALNSIKGFLAAYAEKTDDEEADSSNWIGFCAKIIPKQDNVYDCGAFVCQFAERISRGALIDFLQDDMEEMRKKMLSEILDGELN